jgi:DNA polymerase III alpha subunit
MVWTMIKMNNILPLFSSHYSLNKSILTLDELSKEDEKEKINRLKPVSIFNILKKYKLDEFNLLDRSCSGYIEAYKNSKKYNINFRFGVQLKVCADINNKSQESLETESKINLWALNTQGYYDLTKIYSKSWIDGFYYTNRIDWKNLNEMMTKNLFITIPFYDSFLHKNLLKFGNILPIINNFYPVFQLEKHNLPFNDLIYNAVVEFAQKNKYETLSTHSCYYYGYEDIKAYQVYRCVTQQGQRSTFECPEMDHFCDDSFCWEDYCDKNNIKFLI